MSRTTRCLFAFGLSVSLAAACGDDDTISPGVGGSGGSGGSSGTAGSAGRGGSAGTGGAAGAAGAAGSGGSSAGTGGSSAGTGGSSAGTGGSSAGTGGSSPELPDGGVTDAGDAGSIEEPTDAGPEPVACPDLEEATVGATSSEPNQAVIITRLAFVGANIQVTFRAVVDFNFTSPLQLCTGSDSNTDCDENFYDVGVGDGGAVLLAGDEVTFTTPIGDIVSAESGEIALVNGLPDVDVDPIIRAYVNWGNYVSLDAPDGPNEQSLEEAAVEEGTEGVWTLGDSVEVNGQTTIYATGDVTEAAGFEVCTQTP